MAEEGGVLGEVKLRLVKHRAFELKDGLSSHSGSSWQCWWALRRLTSHLTNQGLANLSLAAWEGPRWEQGTPDGPPGSPLPVWGLFLGNDQNWEPAPAGWEEVEKTPN